MMIVSAIAAFAAASADADGAARQDLSGLVIEAVRYCVDRTEVGADAAAPTGFSADGSSGWIGGRGARHVRVAPGDATLPCMVIAPADADSRLPAWFEGEGFAADHGEGYGFFRRSGRRLIYANWLRPEDTTYDGSAPLLLVAVRSIEEPN